MPPSIGLKLVFNQLLDRLSVKYLQFLRVIEETHEAYIFVDELLLFPNGVIDDIHSNLRQQIERIFDFVDLARIYMGKIGFHVVVDALDVWEYGFIVLSQIEYGVVVGFHDMLIVEMGTRPLLKVKCIAENLTVKQMLNPHLVDQMRQVFDK